MAVENGFNVLKPAFDNGYDRVVDFYGKLNRIQIKETSQVIGPSFFVSTKDSSGKKYRKKFEFFAIYVKPEDTWVIIPASVIDVSSVKINLVKGRYIEYIENWDQLK